MKNIYLITLFTVLSVGGYAQQTPMFTQFFCNTLFQNPAYAGSRDGLVANMIYRNQWTGFDGAPKTLGFSVHTPIFRETSGVGISLFHDKIGISDYKSIQLSYAYRIDFGKNRRLAMGLSGEFIRYQMLWQNSTPFDPMDIRIPYTNNDLFMPNFTAGVYFDTEKFYVGVSVPQMIENKLDFGDNSVATESAAKQKRHYYAMGGMLIPINEDILLKPATLLKYTPNAPFEADLNVSAIFKNTILLGATYRTGDSFDFMVELFFKNRLCIGYAYDITLTKLHLYNKGSHEILLSVDFGKKPRGLDHPRYF